MRLVVTGGGGFIGAWIARRLLLAGHHVRVFDRSEDRRLLRRVAGERADAVEWLCGDIARRSDVDSAVSGCDAVIHLAGMLTPECRANPEHAIRVNLLGTLHVFEAMRANGVKRVVYASTAGVYGADDGDHPAPATLYGVTKLAVEGLARTQWIEHGIASVGFRPYIVYGPGRRGGASAGPSLACEAAVLGRDCEIAYTGEAGMVHVDDVAEAFTQALTRPPKGAHVFNLQGETAAMEQIINAIHRHVPAARISARGAPMPIAPRLASDELDRLMPGLQRTSLADGIARTIETLRVWHGLRT